MGRVVGRAAPGHRVFTEGFVVLLAGVANAAFTALLDTVAELRRTRQELARVAVAEERERFSRDLTTCSATRSR